ncbi:uncharacterized protein LOC124671797 [Lolium rigidum]|uniref:uncharacterized protein LOC124671797 n=1 Tax=Lolium rigidum TaxID=89674 RepID=UPI001F5D5EFE|nr:uncharacterized protein LOC124671797 [Lolium rigidum]
MIGNPKKARKEIKSFYFEKVIDSDLTNYEDLVESVLVQYPPRYLEVAHVQYYDDVLKTFPEIKSDQELMSMFEKHSKTKMVHMFFAYCDPSEPYAPITEYEQIGIDEHVGTDEDSYLCNPIPENDHVGVDEESMYLEKEPTCLNVVLFPNKEKDKDYVAADGSEDGSEDDSEDESEDDSKDESELEEEEELHEANHAPDIEYNKEDPCMTEGSTYPNMDEFKLALSQHAIKHQFEFNTEKSTPCRFRGYCKRRDEDNCPWRIHASTTDNMCTVVVKKNPCDHDCSSARRKKKVKNATKYWVCEKVKDWLIEDATLGATELQKKLKEHHKVKIHYKRVYMGKLLALRELYGDWDNSFDNLYRFKAQVESCCPGSIVQIDHHTVSGKIRFRRIFVAFKPCIDGFLGGCRPYLAIDSTFLTGMFKGQLASATAIDGHNWMYPVSFGVFDSETNENWTWFMQLLRQAIGSPTGLAICTDAGRQL